MPLIDTDSLVANLVPTLDSHLAKTLVEEFISLERRFIQRDWEPTELDAGQFCEVLSRILYHHDSGNLKPSRPFDECLTYIEDEKNQNRHTMNPRQHALHLCKVLRTTYKFRSQRGGVHISPNYKPNHMDARVMVEMVR